MSRGNFLIVAHLPHFFLTFLQSNIGLLQELGFEVHCASNFALNEKEAEQLRKMGVITHQIDVQRSPYSMLNLRAVRQLADLMKVLEVKGVHCHTPTGGLVARLSARRAHVKPVIYTAHGFHFYKGAPLKNWLLYYPVERFLSRYTDVLITINKEDYERAKTFKAGKVYYVPGVGIDLNKFGVKRADRKAKRKELCLKDTDFVLLSVGELIPRKNHAVVIRALAEMRERPFFEHLHYLICGSGVLESELRQLTQELSVEDKVHFLGYRSDISELCASSDLFVFPSLQEGLPVALMEAMASGLPVVCSNIRGNTDLVEDGKSARLVGNDDGEIAAAIDELYHSSQLRERLSQNALARIRSFDLEAVQTLLRDIYTDEFKNNAGG